jgi:two-component system sensor histidine kinase HydH
MAAGIAHEVRNPLAAIGLYAGMIVEDLQPSSADAAVSRTGCGMFPPAATLAACREVAGKIAAAVRGLDGIVNDVLTFAREITPRRQPVFAAELFERIVATHRPAIEAAGVRVVQCCDEELTLDVDANLMHQALVNVIRNAVDAMSGNGGTLTLEAHAGEGQVALVVRDTGPGIAGADIDRIFNPFFTTRNTGTGLGLAIVHRIVDAHRGAITVHNDNGAVFEFILPQHPQQTARSSVNAIGGAVP